MEFTVPQSVVYGASSVDEIEQYIPGKRILIVTGMSSAEKTGLTKRLKAGLEKAGRSVFFFSEVPPEPSVDDLQKCLDKARSCEADAVVSAGGGSVLDTGKAAAGLYFCSKKAEDYFRGVPIEEESLFFCAIPTTAGTGSEATPNSVFLDTERTVKKSIRSSSMIPDCAVLDPGLTVSCPPKVTAYSGLDALVQGIEALFSRHADSFTGAYALRGIQMMNRSLEKAFRDGKDLSAREDMLYGSFFAACSFANARLGAVHGFAHPVGVFSGLPHGLVCARLMMPVLKRNGDACPDTYRILKRELGEDPVIRFAQLLSALDIYPDFNLELTESQGEKLFAYTASAGSMKANPVLFSREEQISILADAGISVSGSHE